MVDVVSGAIYVIGGIGGTYPNYIYFRDVWASTDGGARAGLGQGGWSGGTQRGYYRGYLGVLRGYEGVHSVGYSSGVPGGT